MGIEKTAKGLYIIASVILIACLLLPANSLARTEARYEMRSGDFVFGNDLYASTSAQSIFHQQALTTIDFEDLDINFPVTADNLGLGPSTLGLGIADADSGEGGTAAARGIDGSIPAGNAVSLNNADALGIGASATANVVPFGLVNLAFPDIEQTSFQAYSATETGFYTANFLGIPPPNTGSYPVTTGFAAFSSPVTAPLAIAGPSMPFSEMLNIMPGYERQKTINKSNAAKEKNATAAGNATTNATAGTTAGENNTIKVNRSIFGDLAQNGPVIRAQQAGQGTSQTISGQEIAGAETAVPINYSGRNADDSRLSYPYFPFNAEAREISRMSLLDRMWRNSHLGTMGRAYEGDTSYPTWILPTEFTKSAISMYNWYDVSNMALAYTMPGMHIERRFWDLGILQYNSPFFSQVQGNIPSLGTTIKPTAPAKNITAQNNTTVSGTISDTTGDWLLSNMTAIEGLGFAAPLNASHVITASGVEPSDVYVSPGGPAGLGVNWPMKGPHQLGWVGGPNIPFIAGPSTNPLFPGMGGPDWPPYYWGFGRYKGWR